MACVIDWFLWLVAYPVAALAIGYVIGIQYERGGLWLAVAPVTVVALVLDVVLNWTLFALLLWQPARWGAWTFSQRLEYLVGDTGWRGAIARPVATVLNWIAPRRHIQAWPFPT